MILNRGGLLGPMRSGQRKRSSAVAVPLNPISNWQVWYDITDIATLFQDDEGTIPVTTDAEEVLHCENKGSYGAAADVVHATDGPVYDTDLHANGGMIGDGTDYLASVAIEQTDFNSGDFSVFIVYSNANDEANTWYYDWQDTQCRFLSLASSDFTNIGMAGIGGTLLASSAADTIHGVHAHDEGDDTQYFEVSYNDEAALPGNTTSSGPATDQIFYLGSTAAGGSPYSGTIHEVCLRTPALTAQEIIDMENYTAAKYGITWV